MTLSPNLEEVFAGVHCSNQAHGGFLKEEKKNAGPRFHLVNRADKTIYTHLSHSISILAEYDNKKQWV